MAFLSIVALIIGMIQPRWVKFWGERNRKKVFLFYFTLLISCLSVFFGLIINLLFFILLASIVLALFILLALFIGLINPRKLLLLGNHRNRKQVILQYGTLFILTCIVFVVAGSSVPENEDERIFGGTYAGDLVHDIPEGKGTIRNNSSYYDGEWVQGVRDGNGTEYIDYGIAKMKYEGEWKGNKEDGYGKMIMKVLWFEMTYEGEWKAGVRDGFGKYVDRDGNVYEGEWVDDHPNGQGKIFFDNGGTYEGQVRDFQPDGYGIAISSSGEKYEGVWSEGE